MQATSGRTAYVRWCSFHSTDGRAAPPTGSPSRVSSAKSSGVSRSSQVPVAGDQEPVGAGQPHRQVAAARLHQPTLDEVAAGVDQLGGEGLALGRHVRDSRASGRRPGDRPGTPGRGRRREAARRERPAGRLAQRGRQDATGCSCSASLVMVWWPPVWLTAILRGLASSATGMVRVSTPSEYSASILDDATPWPRVSWRAKVPVGPLVREPLRVARGVLAPLGPDRERAVLDVDVDGCRVDAGQVDLRDEAVTRAVEVHRHRGRGRRAQGAAEHAVEVAEGVECGGHEVLLD